MLKYSNVCNKIKGDVVCISLKEHSQTRDIDPMLGFSWVIVGSDWKTQSNIKPSLVQCLVFAGYIYAIGHRHLEAHTNTMSKRQKSQLELEVLNDFLATRVDLD